MRKKILLASVLAFTLFLTTGVVFPSPEIMLIAEINVPIVVLV